MELTKLLKYERVLIQMAQSIEEIKKDVKELKENK